MREKLLEKVKKLINMERGAREINSQGEAENFAARIQELINKYQFSDDELNSLDAEELKLEHEVILTGKLSEWQEILFCGISEVNNCIAIFTPFCVMAVGSKQERQIVRELFGYFNSLCRELAQHEKTRIATNRINPFFDFSEAFKLSDLIAAPSPMAQQLVSPSEHMRQFFLGLVCQISHRMAAEKASAVEDQKQNHPDSMALVVLDKKSVEAEAHVKKHFPWVEMQDRKLDEETFNSEAFQRGAEVGSEIALTNKILSEENK